MARMTFSPVTPVMSSRTVVNFRFISPRAFCTRWMCWPDRRTRLAQPGGVGRERADGVGPVRGGFDTDPVAGVADVDGGGVLVPDGQRGESGGLVGLAADLLGLAGGAAEVVGAGRCGGGRAGAAD